MTDNALFIHDVNKIYVSKTTDSIDDEPYGVIKLHIECENVRFDIFLFGPAEMQLEPEPKVEPLWVPDLEDKEE